MESKDILLSTSSSEEPLVHIVSVNGIHLQVGYQLSNITLMGASLQSVNSEYRMINLNSVELRKLIAGDLKQYKVFYDAKKKLDAALKNGTISSGKDEVKRITLYAIDYALIYYLACVFFRYNEANIINMNKFSSVIPLFDVIRKHVGDIAHANIAGMMHHLLSFTDGVENVGSKMLLLSRNDLEHTNDLKYPVWKEIYIYKLIRSIPSATRGNYLCPMIDWGVVKYPSKQLFTNDALISKLNFGSNINYIRHTARRQSKLSHDLIIGSMKQYELNEIKNLTDQLVESTKDINYALDDISLLMFFENKQQTLDSAINSVIDLIATNGLSSVDHPVKDLLFDVESLKRLIFQYLFAVLLLARQGIIHNDPHMNNVLISTRKAAPLSVGLPNGKLISMGMSNLDMTIIDFDKAVLSHHHHNFFDEIAKRINEEMGIAFDSVKDTIVDDYNQVFNCYVMYDIVRFVFNIRKIITDMRNNVGHLAKNLDISKHDAFIDSILKPATDILSGIYTVNAELPFSTSEPHNSVLWLIEKAFKDYIKINKSKSSMDTVARFIDTKSFVSDETPEFISSKRRYADKLKMHFLADYVAKNIADLQ